MHKLKPKSPITAVLYSDGRDVDPLMVRLAALLRDRGVALAGFVQRNAPRQSRRRCDMILQDLATGADIAISEDRGALARGCHLNVGELLRAEALGCAALDAGADLLIVNKFGKTEGEGGGLRPLIAEALLRSIPVLVAVPWRNIDSWRLFTGGFAHEVQIASLPVDGANLLSVLGFSFAATGATAHICRNGL